MLVMLGRFERQRIFCTGDPGRLLNRGHGRPMGAAALW